MLRESRSYDAELTPQSSDGKTLMAPGIVTNSRSLWIAVVSFALLIAVGLADTVGLKGVELAGLYVLIPLFVGLKERSRMVYPVALFSCLIYSGSQAASTILQGADRNSSLVLLINSAVQISVLGAGMILVHTLQVLHRTALIDHLTGVMNRRGLAEAAPRVVRNAVVRRKQLCAMTIDVDAFKNLNDTLGHEAGDQVLRAIGSALNGFRRRNGLAVRMGGDEFLLILTVDSEHEARALTHALRYQVKAKIKETGLPATITIGMAFSAKAPESIEELINQADRAMYQNKVTTHAAVERPNGAGRHAQRSSPVRHP